MSVRTRVARLPLALAAALIGVLALSMTLAAASPAAGGCANEQLREESRLDPTTGEPYDMGLPDCRAYEQVTPVEKNGGVVTVQNGIEAIATDGSSLLGTSYAAFAGLTDGELATETTALYRFARTGEGWKTTPLTCCGLQYANPDNNGPVWQPAQKTGEGAGVAHLSLSNADGSIGEIGPVWPPALGPAPEGNAYLVEGAAGEASHGVVFKSYAQALLWPFDRTVISETKATSLYEYVGTCGGEAECEEREPALVGVEGPAGSTTLVGECGISLGAAESEAFGSTYNAVSESGQSVFFTAQAHGRSLSSTPTPAWASTSTCSEGGKTGTAPPTDELYARLDGSQTVWVSEPQCTPVSACQDVSTEPYTTEAASKAAAALFEGASADGSKVFFTTTQQLLNGDTDTTRDLYEYDFDEPAGQRLIQVSAGGSGDQTPGAGAEVEGVSRISEDGSHVYFVARGVLTTSPSPDAQGYGEHGEAVQTGAVAQPGAENLYVYDTETKQTAFIADLCSGPEASGSLTDAQCPSSLNSEPWNYGPSRNDQHLWSHGEEGGDHERPVSATPDGGFLAFTSYGDLTADDTSTARQVFQYDAQQESLVRVSVGRDGLHDNGNAEGGSAEDASIVSNSYSQGTARGGQFERTMSDDGSYVFFQSPVGLTPGALNDVPVDAQGDLAQNVYEYHDGGVSLISDGRDTSAFAESDLLGSGVSLIGTDASGADVFFSTVDPLVAQDTDTQLDVYDARIGGGFPAPSASTECQGEACQGLPGVQSLLGGPSSATFSGPGNLAPPPPGPVKKAQAKPLTRAQKLARALKACIKKSKRKQRRSCESRARKRFGAKAKAKKRGKATQGDRRGR